MSRRFITSVSVVVALLVTVVVIDARDQRDVIKAALSEQTYFNCGLEKLDTRERENIFGLIGAYPVVSYTQSAAEAYMRNQGWRQVRVLGAVLVDTTFEERHVVVADHYDMYLLDPSIVPYLPDPGVYWAYGVGSAWKLLYPDGYEGSFWAREIE